MPRLLNLLQTIRSENADDLLLYAPIFCEKDPWLGKGYYFWDNLRERARWWGVKRYNNEYYVCEAYADIEDGRYLDLVGTTGDLLKFRNWYSDIRKSHKGKDVTISWMIAKLRRDNNFPFDALRAESRDCGDDYKVHFVTKNTNSYLNLNPAIQVCIYNKNCIKDYKIIYSSIDECNQWCV